jgi:serine protease inhibitor
MRAVVIPSRSRRSSKRHLGQVHVPIAQRLCMGALMGAIVLGGGACKRAPKAQRITKVKVASEDTGAVAAQTDSNRVLAPIELSNSIVERTLAGLREFSNRLTRQVWADSSDLTSNAAFSPVSVALTLGMLSAAADEATLLRASNGMGLAPDELHRAMHWLQLDIARAGVGPLGNSCRGCDAREIQQTVFANGTWFQARPVRPELRATLVEHYAADIATIAPSIREDIRVWVDRKTLGLIPDFRENVKPNDLSEFVNVLYLSAGWQPHFESRTPFHFAAPGKRRAEAKAFRSVWADGKYLSAPKYEAVTVSYAGGALEALILLPRAGQFDAVSRQLDNGAIVPQSLLRDANGVTLVDVTMPEFEATSRIGELEPLLNTVTGNVLRDGKFAYYAGQGFGPVDANAVQRVYVHVNEKGTLAAAATLISTVAVSARVGRPRKPPVPVVIRVERPFFFFVRTTGSGVVVFVARVTQPVWVSARDAASAAPESP